MTGHREWIDDHKPCKVKMPVRFGNNEYLYAIGEGSVPVVPVVGNEHIKVRIKNVSYVPNIGLNLVSLRVADDNGISFDLREAKLFTRWQRSHSDRLKGQWALRTQLPGTTASILSQRW